MKVKWHHGSIGWSCSGEMAEGEVRGPDQRTRIDRGPNTGKTRVERPCPKCRISGRRTWVIVRIE